MFSRENLNRLPYLALQPTAGHVLAKTSLNAINYRLNQWEAPNIYTTCDGNLAIDNNIAKRAVKPFAIGRTLVPHWFRIKVESR